MGSSTSKEERVPPHREGENGGESPHGERTGTDSARTLEGAAAAASATAGAAVDGSSGDGEGCPYKKASGDLEVKTAPSWAWGCPHRGKKEAAESSPESAGKAPDAAAASAASDDTSRRRQNAPADGGGWSGGGGCPVKGEKLPVQYNVYSQPIDPSNRMPASSAANQLPNPNQTMPLPTERVSSTIPKGGTEDTTWTYPSPQMFYNAITRKNKSVGVTDDPEGAEEEQAMMETVVALHNNMNETTWAKILEWEDLVDTDDTSEGSSSGAKGNKGPKLLRFCGRPSDLSPKARFKHWALGHPLPFDRHDWVVVREDGTEVRYVIDYYHDESRSSASTPTDGTASSDGEGGGGDGAFMPRLGDRGAVRSILLDVRPALDGPSAAFRRGVVMPLARRGMWFSGSRSDFEPLPLVPTPELRSQSGESVRLWDEIQERGRDLRTLVGGDGRGEGEEVASTTAADSSTVVDMSEEEAVRHAKNFARVLKDCREAQRAVDRACGDDGVYGAECARASLRLTMCMAEILCPLQYGALKKSLNADPEKDGYDATVDAALENATLCVAAADGRIASARREHPELFRGG